MVERPAAALAVLALALSATMAAAQSRPADPRDLSGIWMNDNTLDERMKREGRTRQTAEELAGPRAPAARPLTPAYQELLRKREAARARLAEGAQACAWPGMPGILTYPYPFEVLHTPGRITFIYEAESQVRRIFLDRDKHLPEEDLDPSYNGDSIGRWEGDVLVIDTVGFNTFTEAWGLPHSEKLRIGERIRWLDGDTIENEVTLTDPKAFTQPIVRKVVYSRRPDWRIREYSCNENNRDAPDAKGQRTRGVVRQKR